MAKPRLAIAGVAAAAAAAAKTKRKTGQPIRELIRDPRGRGGFAPRDKKGPICLGGGVGDRRERGRGGGDEARVAHWSG